MIYFFFPETARLTLEEIAKNFGEEVAVHVTDATDEEQAQLERKLSNENHCSQPSENGNGQSGQPDIQSASPKIEREIPKMDEGLMN